MRIAINGMGRIGRLLFRRLLEHNDIELVAVNDIMAAKNLVYLLKYDSVYGTFQHDILQEDNHIITAGRIGRRDCLPQRACAAVIQVRDRESRGTYLRSHGAEGA